MNRLIDDRTTRLFIALAAFFCVNAVLAEFIGVKIFALEDTLGIQPLEWNLFGQSGSLSRSEEHTSELQSLMRISYAVFCLKKKKKNHTQRIYNNTYPQ